MPTRPRIAVVSAGPTVLPVALGELGSAPRVQLFRDLYGAADALRQFQPAAILVEIAKLPREDRGALRMVRSWMPDVGLVLVGAEAASAELRELADHLDATALPRPFTATELSAVLDSALAEPRRAMTAALLDLVRGISDEVNNPLMVTAGYVQLLQTRLDPALHRDELDMLGQIQSGLDRVSATMAKIRVLTRADEAPGSREPVDLDALASAVTASVALATKGSLSYSATPPTSGGHRCCIDGQPALLEAMLEHLCRAGVALLAANADAQLRLEADDHSVRLALALDSTVLPAWRLPRTFEPYYLNRVLRGTPEGLSLFLVQVVAQTHGGRALARRQSGHGVCLEVELPA